MKGGDQLNWNQVFYFSEIAAAGSVKGAAEKLGLSSSTLSEHLTQLEEHLHLKLFHRAHRRLELTTDGARLFQYARQMFETGRRFIDVISPQSLGGYPVSVGLVPGPSYFFAHDILATYAAAHRDASMHVLRYQHEAMEEALLDAKLSFGFTDRKSDARGLVQTLVASSELGFFASDAVPRKDLATLLREYPLILCRAERSVPSAVEEVLESLDLPPGHVIVSEYPSLVESLCRRGAGIAVLGRAHFKAEAGVRALRLPREFPDLSEKLYATWVTDGENSEAVRRLKPLLPRL